MNEQLTNKEKQFPSESEETIRVHADLAKIYREVHNDPIHADYLETIPDAANLYDQGIADTMIEELTGEAARAVAEKKDQIDKWDAKRSAVQGLIQKSDFAEVPTIFYPKHEHESDEQFAHRNYDFAIHSVAQYKNDIMAEIGLAPTYAEFRKSKEPDVS